MGWLLVVIVALIMGAITDMIDRNRKTSAFGLALLFAVIVGAAYTFFLYLRMVLP